MTPNTKTKCEAQGIKGKCNNWSSDNYLGYCTMHFNKFNNGKSSTSAATCSSTSAKNPILTCSSTSTHNSTDFVPPSTPHGFTSSSQRLGSNAHAIAIDQYGSNSHSISVERDLPISSSILSQHSNTLTCKGTFKTGTKAQQRCGSTNIYPNGYCYKHQSQANSNHSPQNSLNPIFTQSSDPISSKLQKEIAKEERLLTTHQAKLQKAKQEYTIFSTQSQEIESLKDRTATLELYISQLVSQLANLGVSVERPTPQTTSIRRF